ncbi:MAG TPA: zf-HC2 domain-containing protein [Anaerolineales bacterium]|nr:zf-HC2 domain-containing protein [Anaerolineales bacterium]HRF46441.1 zf-HC2 domain-containing protein [Anaerolineales bacterium]
MEEHHCQHLLGELSAYVEGEASEALCAEIREHLAGCENCRAVVDTLNKTIQLYHTLPQPDLSDGARQRLYRTLNLEALLKP